MLESLSQIDDGRNGNIEISPLKIHQNRIISKHFADSTASVCQNNFRFLFMGTQTENQLAQLKTEQGYILDVINKMSKGEVLAPVNNTIFSKESTAILEALTSLKNTKKPEGIGQAFDRSRFLENVFSLLPDLVSYMDRDLNYLYVNKAYEQWFGIKRENCLGKNIVDVLGTEGVKKLRPYLDKTFMGEAQSFEISVPYIYGGMRAIAVRYVPDFDAFKNVIGITVIVKDITQNKSDELIRDVISETMHDGYVIQDQDNVIVSFNRAALKILGLTEDQLLGRTSYDPNWKAIRENGTPFDGAEHPSNEAQRTGKAVRGVLMGLVLPSGESRWIRINATPYDTLYGTQNQRHVVCSFSDVTDYFSMQTETRFVLDALQIGVWKYNPVNQSLHCDQSMYKIFDIDQKNFTDHYQAWESTLDPKAKAHAVEELGRALRGEKEFDTTYEINTRSRGKRLISARGSVIRDGSGNPVLMYGINIDVTKEKEREKEIAEQHRSLSLLADNMSGVVSQLDKEGRYIFANRLYQDWFAVHSKDIIGKTPQEILPVEVYAAAETSIAKAKAGLKASYEIPIFTQEQKAIWAYMTFIPIFDDQGLPDGYFIISYDITQLKDATSKLVHASKLASLGEMCAGIAHEINNPLAIVAATASVLPLVKNDEKKFHGAVENIAKASSRIEKIVKGLRKFSRTTEKVPYKTHSLNQIIAEALILIEAKAKTNSVQVTSDVQADLTIFCDELEIEQVLVNLINNGIDAASKSAGKWLNLSAFTIYDEVIIQVTDSGEGISPKLEQKIFQPFFTTKAVGEGTGLGLSIANGIITEHRASLELNKSKINTCFEIRFQMAKTKIGGDSAA